MSKQMTYADFRTPTDLETLTLLFPHLFHPVPDTKQTMSEQKLSNDEQIGGKHYKKCAVQPWDYVIANDLDYFQGSIIKYVTRWKDKGGVEDLKKAKHFLDKYIETMEEKYKHLVERPE
jgi:hypothetical protein